jgi:hypothetical protein
MTKADLRRHILTRLGAPVINIELAPEQMDIYINDAIKRFIEVHYDGLDTGVIFLSVNPGTTTYTLPSNIHSVMEIMSSNGSAEAPGDLVLVNPYMSGDTYSVGNYNYSNFSFVDMEMYNQNMAMWRSYGSAGQQTMFQHNSTTGELSLFVNPTESCILALKVHASPETHELLYENEWVQKFSTCLCQIAWAQNISKYEGATLPGGVNLNFQQILAEGKESKEFLETELYERYQEPIDFYFG